MKVLARRGREELRCSPDEGEKSKGTHQTRERRVKVLARREREGALQARERRVKVLARRGREE